MYLPGIRGEIEKLCYARVRIHNQLVCFRSDGALKLAIKAKDAVVLGCAGATYEIGQAGKLNGTRNWDTGQFAGSGKKAVLIDQLLHAAAGRDSGTGNHQRHPDA